MTIVDNMKIDDNRGGGVLQKNQNQYDVIYGQPLIKMSESNLRSIRLTTWTDK